MDVKVTLSIDTGEDLVGTYGASKSYFLDQYGEVPRDLIAEDDEDGDWHSRYAQLPTVALEAIERIVRDALEVLGENRQDGIGAWRITASHVEAVEAHGYDPERDDFSDPVDTPEDYEGDKYGGGVHY